MSSKEKCSRERKTLRSGSRKNSEKSSYEEQKTYQIRREVRETTRKEGISLRENVTYQVRLGAKEGYFNRMPESPKKKQRICYSADRKSPPLNVHKEDKEISASEKSSTEKQAVCSSKSASKEEGLELTERSEPSSSKSSMSSRFIYMPPTIPSCRAFMKKHFMKKQTFNHSNTGKIEEHPASIMAMSGNEHSHNVAKYNPENDQEEEEEIEKEESREKIMFREGDRVRIAHFPGPEFGTDKSEFCEHSVSSNVGSFARIFGIFKGNNRHYPSLASIEKASHEVKFNIRLESDICNLNRFDFPVKSEDVVNYSLLGKKDGDACFEETRSRELPFKDLVETSRSILNAQFIENLEKVSDSEKQEVVTVTKIFQEQSEFYYRKLFILQRDLNRKLRNEIHQNALDKKKKS